MKRNLRISVVAVVLCNAFTTQAQTPDFYLKDFQKLHWLKGKWKGGAEKELPFFEQYQVVNDSTMAILYFKDSSFAGSPDTGWVYLQEKEIIHRSEKMLWKVTSLTNQEILFRPVNARNRFHWLKKNNNEWKAVLQWNDKDGKLIEKNYTIKRINE